jgi:hypothetical protein
MLAWTVVGRLGAENPQPARAGQSYPLQAQSNCRYASGTCDLENVDFKARLVYRESADGQWLQLDASHALAGAVLSLGPPETDPAPQSMQHLQDDGTRWVLPLATRPAPTLRIRLVLSTSLSTYFVETGTAFLQSESQS